MYLTPEKITAALSGSPSTAAALTLLGCTSSPAPNATWNVYTPDGVLAFTGTIGDVLAWLRNPNPSCAFAELSPMRRDRLVAAFVSPGRDLLADHRMFAFENGRTVGSDLDGLNSEIVEGIWDGFARYGGWTYLECLEDPASVASEALSQWSSQTDSDECDDPGAYEGC